MSISRYEDQTRPRVVDFTEIDAPRSFRGLEFTETDEWTFGTGKACGASHINAAYQCHMPTTAAPAPKASAGGSAAGAGTVHELELYKALGGKSSKVVEEKLAQNKAISGKNGETASRIAKQNAADLRADLKSRGVEEITDVQWTAQMRGDQLAKAAGVKGLSEQNNQSDILVKGKTANGEEVTYGVSLKAATSGSTKYPNDIPFFNGGLNKEAGRFGADDAASKAKSRTESAKKELGVKSTTNSAAKAEIRSTPGMKAKADALGKDVLKGARDDMMTSMQNKSPEEMRGLLSTMTGAPTGAGQGLPTLKLTGYATGKQTTKIEDAVNGKVPTAIRGAKKFDVAPAGNTGIRISADGVPVMKIRTKWESQALASSIKMSGEAP